MISGGVIIGKGRRVGGTWQMGVSEMRLGRRTNQEDQARMVRDGSKYTPLHHWSVIKAFPWSSAACTSDGSRFWAIWQSITRVPPVSLANGSVCTRGARMLISTRVGDFPRSRHVAQFSRSYLEFRPWNPSSNDLRGRRPPSQR